MGFMMSVAFLILALGIFSAALPFIAFKRRKRLTR